MRGYLPHYLSRLMNLLNLRLLQYLRPLKLSIQQFRVMQVVRVRRVASVGEIFRDAVLEQSVTSRIVDQLEIRGLAKRRKRRNNARVVEVVLTPLGRRTYDSITPYSSAVVEDAVSALTADEKRQLERLLERIFLHVSQPHGYPRRPTPPSPRSAAAARDRRVALIRRASSRRQLAGDPL